MMILLAFYLLIVIVGVPLLATFSAAGVGLSCRLLMPRNTWALLLIPPLMAIGSALVALWFIRWGLLG